MDTLDDWKAAEEHAETLEREFRRMQVASVEGFSPPPTAEDLEAMMQARERATILVHALAAQYGVKLAEITGAPPTRSGSEKEALLGASRVDVIADAYLAGADAMRRLDLTTCGCRQHHSSATSVHDLGRFAWQPHNHGCSIAL